MNEDFEFDDNFMENSEDGFNAKLEEWRERLMLNAIETNYEQIKKNGISEWHLRNMDEGELKDLNITLQMMLDHYTLTEEYEKCQLIFENVKKVKDCINVDI